ncbi:hypothetical protein Salat_0220300 [Sesamum alatum]|uniref:Uncharacterized protein n=1 Tax=Sesamum alatum TaxID=300844 RepID=A0AAE2CY40_9LAMI|nr:hypothetical protein Salat_0220300 [Sesamum alatum]
MWLRHPEFLSTVATNCSFPTLHTGMKGLAEKLRRLKNHLKHWNATVFGDVFSTVKTAEEAAAAAEKRYDTDPSESNLLELNWMTAKWQLAISAREDYWRQKSACK